MRKPYRYPETDPATESETLTEALFGKMLCLERKRAERSGKRFVLMLLEFDFPREDSAGRHSAIFTALSRATRETDLKGWYQDGSIVGVIFTEIGSADGKSIAGTLLSRVNAALNDALGCEEIGKMRLSLHVFPDDWNRRSGGDSTLYPELGRDKTPVRFERAMKRAIDIGGSLAGLMLLSPLLLLIAAAVKLSSRGPALFRQERLGRHGRPFTFLKFRSMYVRSDAKIHERYVKEFIAGTAARNPASGGKVFKLTADPRITPLGRFLRRTSLDELPQLINVLLGDMSLVGPRPPIAYEFKQYSPWHKRRLLQVKPGITGLWQVAGRSKTTFDEMVRMDINYATSWSVWLDIKILLQTPVAVFSGEGAY